jgi:SAM-dependent methyltransferase
VLIVARKDDLMPTKESRAETGEGGMYRLYNRLRAYLIRLLDVSIKLWERRIRYFASFIPKDFDLILDVGCGNGLVLSSIDNVDHPLMVGVDVEVKAASKRYQHVLADALHLPFRENAFPLVTVFSVIEHIAETRRTEFYDELRRVTKNSLLIELPNRHSLIEAHSYLPLFGFLPSKIHSLAYGGGSFAVPFVDMIITSLEQSGFEIVYVKKCAGLFLPLGKLLNSIGVFRSFPVSYMIECKK